jgi:hypothetical protein
MEYCRRRYDTGIRGAVVSPWLGGVDMQRIIFEVFLILVGLVLGLVAADPFEDYIAPHVFDTDADMSLVSREPLGRERIVKVKTRYVLADHDVYIVVEANGRYWPQGTLKEHFKGEVPILLGGIGQGDVGHSYTVQILAVSGSANARVHDYFVKIGDRKSPLRHTGIDFNRVENDMESPLASITLKRAR